VAWHLFDDLVDAFDVVELTTARLQAEIGLLRDFVLMKKKNFDLEVSHQIFNVLKIQKKSIYLNSNC
jgi:hypothetical protein